ncbi:two component transcriptional regulator, LuxR family [Thioalkalivibrio sulfidiphilus HL-EbGr7]|uniref:Two component transcriptional regulator, LuxR family n=1 Tax=Thioalkalivibrio sulfidiphilus (strain HL-EbGR7) TaxID=396588 RepID=B8GU88_THISH|nr:response regulator transcription factor [Thioalkalivibrio sulfidiphilus]ACL71371.1 two component transcriptional regulator, LuxR family [Thioalkalivibrio sulfidiphilus HL-EbGr7]
MILIATNEPARLERWRVAAGRFSKELVDARTIGVVHQGLARKPDALVLLDLDLPDLNDGDGVEALLAEFHNARILAFSSHYSDAEGEVLVGVGVQGYLSMDAPADRITQALDRVMQGEMWLTRHLMEYILKHDQQARAMRRNTGVHSKLMELTPRQLEVALMVANGLSNKAIGKRLMISERTVKAHVSAILERTAAQSRTELAVQLSDYTPAGNRQQH